MEPQQQSKEQDLWAEIGSANKLKLFEPLECVPGRDHRASGQEESAVPGDTVPWESPCPISPSRQDRRGNALSSRSGAELGLWQLWISGGMQKYQQKLCLFNTQVPQFPFAFQTLFTLYAQEGQELPGRLTAQNGPVPEENLPLVLARKHKKRLDINLGQHFLFKPSTQPRNK